MKRILFTFLILSSVAVVRAQSTNSSSVINDDRSAESGLKLRLSINPGITVGRGGSTFALGGELSLHKKLIANLDGTFSAGYTNFFYGDNSQEGKLIPVKAGVRYTVKPRLYVGLNAGVAFSINDGGAYFMYSPMVEWNLNKQFNIGLKYDHYSDEPPVLGPTLTYKF